jgi:hypothetical protein
LHKAGRRQRDEAISRVRAPSYNPAGQQPNGGTSMSIGRGTNRRTGAVAAALVLLTVPAVAQAQGIPGVLAPGATPQLVQEGFKFTEGPLAADGGL